MYVKWHHASSKVVHEGKLLLLQPLYYDHIQQGCNVPVGMSSEIPSIFWCCKVESENSFHPLYPLCVPSVHI